MVGRHGRGAPLVCLVTRTRIGMLIRAGASNRTMVSALGVNIRLLYTLVFGFGAGTRRPGRADGQAPSTPCSPAWASSS